MSAREPIAASFVEALAGFKAAELPESTVEKAHLCLVDFLSCAFAGRRLPWAEHAIAAARAWPAANGAVVIADSLKLSAGEAAYVNSVMAACASRTDMHAPSTTHPSSVVFPVALALACLRPVSGADFIGAVVAGYEAMGRLGRIMVDDRFKRNFRATSVVGSVGGAVTAARILRLDPRQAVNALALSANTAAGLMEWAYSGEVDLFFQPANAARAAVTAALLAREGVVASASILEGRGGMLAAFGGLERAHELLESGPRWEIENIDFKPVPACVFVQAAAHAAEDLITRHRVTAAEIRSVRLRTFESALKYPGCNNPGPLEAIQPARESLQYAVASVLARRELTDANFTDIGNESIRLLTPRVQLEADPVFSADYPSRQGAEVEVCTTDGRKVTGRVEDVPPFGASRVIERFRRVALPLFPPQRVAQLEQSCLDCVRSAQIASLMELMTRAESMDRKGACVGNTR